MVADLAAVRARRPGAAEFKARHGFGYSVFEHTAHGIRAELTVFVALDAAVKFSVLRLHQRVGPARASCQRDRLRRVGARRPAREDGAAHRHRGGSRQRRAVRPQPVQLRLRRLDRLLRRRRRPARRRQLHRATGPSSSGATARCNGRRPWRARASADASAPRSIRARRSRCPSTLLDGESRRRSCSASAWAAAPTRPSSWCSASAARPRAPTRSRPCDATGERRSAPCRSARPTRRSTCSSTAGCSTRRSPAASGRAAATTSRAARSASATSCRTRWRSCTPQPQLLREQLLRCAGAPVRRGRRAALVAPAAGPRRAHAHLRRLPVAAAGAGALCRGDRRHRACSTSRCRYLEGRPVNPPDDSYYDLPLPSGAEREPVPARRATRCGTACASARTACR